ncbi:MAG TPA: MOSC N-terminal beta barrel domain-containing protein, partial [Mycobacterium sp.]|nr:MOSC N-terminal beta barrel domain-containing protein [Mycobacterium sp.]
MIQAGRIVSVWRYPVKSMAGERVASADLTTLGVHADRTWAVRDVEHATTTGAKKLPGLLWCTARYRHTPPADAGPGHAPEVIIGFPGGGEISSSDPGVHRALSEYVDREVEL